MKYFDLKQAANDIRCSLGAKDKSIACVKLAGKTVFNTALFTGRVVLEKGKEISDQKEKHMDVSNDKLKQLQGKGTFAEKVAASSILKEREPGSQPKT